MSAIGVGAQDVPGDPAAGRWCRPLDGLSGAISGAAMATR